MYDEFIEFMTGQQVGVLATQLLDGKPHGATVDFVFIPDSLHIVIQTDPTSKKCVKILNKGTSGASFVVGFNPIESVSAQFDGMITPTSDSEFCDYYATRFPEKVAQYTQDIFLLFTPDWWRYTDWTKQGRKMILTSGSQ